MRLGAIVEGHGDEAAVPVLVRRLAAWIDPGLAIQIVTQRLSRGRLAKEQEVRTAIEAVSRRVGPGSPLLVVLDEKLAPRTRAVQRLNR